MSIPRGFEIRFEARTRVPEPYEIHWQVVNTGEEAVAAEDLRGRVVAGTRVHRETTKYRGFHWIQCFIVKNGAIVARSKEFVVGIK